MRLSASLRFRFLGTFGEKPMDMFNVLNLEPDQRPAMVEICLSPVQHNLCRTCEGSFLVQLRSRLDADPPLNL